LSSSINPLVEFQEFFKTLNEDVNRQNDYKVKAAKEWG
jgi:hypothetical protein